ncbi:MAG: hypothetical protein ACYTXA_28930 [Nostoc sp.]
MIWFVIIVPKAMPSLRDDSLSETLTRTRTASRFASTHKHCMCVEILHSKPLFELLA